MKKVDKIKRRMAKSIVCGRKALENIGYGKFILQTNEVQFLLSYVIMLCSTFPADKNYSCWLKKRAGLGALIDTFGTCAPKTIRAYILFNDLKEYKRSRDKLAHKMFPKEKSLTPAECDKAIVLGNKILNQLYRLCKIPKNIRPRF